MIDRIKSWLPHTEISLPVLGTITIAERKAARSHLSDEQAHLLVVEAFTRCSENGSGTE